MKRYEMEEMEEKEKKTGSNEFRRGPVRASRGVFLFGQGLR